MRKKVDEEELKRIRKIQQARKELEFEIGRDLKHEFGRLETEDRMFADKNPYVIAAINFFGTLIIGYALYFVASVLFPLILFAGTYIKIFIWGLSIASAFRRRSLLEKFF